MVPLDAVPLRQPSVAEGEPQLRELVLEAEAAERQPRAVALVPQRAQELAEWVLPLAQLLATKAVLEVTEAVLEVTETVLPPRWSELPMALALRWELELALSAPQWSAQECSWWSKVRDSSFLVQQRLAQNCWADCSIQKSARSHHRATTPTQRLQQK